MNARRDEDARDATVSWKAVPGAVGYNVRWGLRPDRLNLCYQVFFDQGTTLKLRSLTDGIAYDIAVETFDENGVSAPSRVVHLR